MAWGGSRPHADSGGGDFLRLGYGNPFAGLWGQRANDPPCGFFGADAPGTGRTRRPHGAGPSRPGIPRVPGAADLAPAESVGRAHLARILFESGQVASIQEAFARYLAPGRPAYVPLPKQSPSQVLRLLQACGAVPVLAHPGQYGFSPAGLESLLKQWQREGLMGLEVYHSANRPVPPYLRLARSLGLMVTGGSDFHGGDGYHSPLGSQTKDWRSVSQDMERLLSALGK